MLLKGHIFIIFFFFYILPQILLVTIFVTEICFYHQLNFFYKCSPLYLIPVLFKVFFLNALFDYAVQNKKNLNKYIYSVNINGVIFLKITKKYKNDSVIQNNFDYLCTIYEQTKFIILDMGQLNDIYKTYKSKIQFFNLFFFSIGWFYIIIYYLYSLWYFFTLIPF